MSVREEELPPATRDDGRRAELLERRQDAARVAPRLPRHYSARRRCERLCDPGAFVELSSLRRARAAPYAGGPAARDGDGVVTGWGLVAGRPTVVVAHDFGFAGGSIGAAFAEKVTRAQRLAVERRCPIVYLNDSGGARIHEGIEALHGCGEILALNVRAQRVVPQVSVIVGPCAGAAAYSPALTDWTIMVRGHSQMFLTGPAIVRAATGEEVDAEALGGSAVHAAESGVAHLEAPDERAALALARRLLGFVPQAAGAPLPRRAPASPPSSYAAELADVVPLSPAAPFDMRDVLLGVLDDASHIELMAGVGPSVLTGLGWLDGTPVGIVANQPRRRGGILDSRTALKAARLVRFCARFGIPIVTFVDVPGFLPGTAEERRGVITHGAELVAAYAEAAVPKLTVIVRKAYGGAYIALGSRALGADFSWAWPDAEIAVMGPEGAVRLLHRRELDAASDAEAMRRALTSSYRESVTSPFTAAGSGMIDDVILPEETRARLIAALRILVQDEHRAHDAEPWRPAADPSNHEGRRGSLRTPR